MDELEDTIERVQDAIEQRRYDGYPEDFRIAELFKVTLGDLSAVVDELQRFRRGEK